MILCYRHFIMHIYLFCPSPKFEFEYWAHPTVIFPSFILFKWHGNIEKINDKTLCISLFPKLFQPACNFPRHQMLHRYMVGTFPHFQNALPLYNVGKPLYDAWQVGRCSSCGPQRGELLGELTVWLAGAFPHFVFCQTPWQRGQVPWWHMS